VTLFPPTPTPKPASAPTIASAPRVGLVLGTWRRSDLTRQRAGKALHFGDGVPRFVLVVAGDGYAVGTASGGGVVDLEVWAAAERVPLPELADLGWLRAG